MHPFMHPLWAALFSPESAGAPKGMLWTKRTMPSLARLASQMHLLIHPVYTAHLRSHCFPNAARLASQVLPRNPPALLRRESLSREIPIRTLALPLSVVAPNLTLPPPVHPSPMQLD